MRTLYVAKRWRYALFMYPFALSSVLLAGYVGDAVYELSPLTLVNAILVSLAAVLLAMAVTPIELSNIELTDRGVVGPIQKGLETRRRQFNLEDIDLRRSRCRFLRAYLRTHDGRKMMVSSPALGMKQVRSLFTAIRQTKG